MDYELRIAGEALTRGQYFRLQEQAVEEPPAVSPEGADNQSRREDDPIAWMASAACKDADPGQFFSEDKKVVKEVKEKYCEHCPVKNECDEYYLAEGLKFGIWGGISQKERRKAIKVARQQR